MAQDTTAGPALALLASLRVDDQFSAQLGAALRLRCAAEAESAREDCGKRTEELLRDVDEHPQLARLMTPYIERTYDAGEIASLTNFYASPDGKAVTALIVYASAYRVDPRTPRPAPMPAEVQSRVNTFLQTGAGRKFTQKLPEFRQELDRQSATSFCATLQRRGSSCAALGMREPESK